MEKENIRVKRSLVIQSFAPLFLLLTIKHLDSDLYRGLICKFFYEIKESGLCIVLKAIHHQAFGGLFVSALGIAWLLTTIFIALGFKGMQSSGFISAGEQIIIANTETEGSAIFLVTYVLPLLTDDVSTFRGLVVFVLMLVMVIALLINSKTLQSAASISKNLLWSLSNENQ